MTDTPDLDELMKRIRAEIAAKTAVPAAGSPAQEAAGGEGPRQPITSEGFRRTFSVRELLRGKRNEDFIRSMPACSPAARAASCPARRSAACCY